jgi:DNA-binding CsgD family transcriptional regulator
VVTPSAGPERLVEARERLALLDGVPERGRRALWLQAAGLSYEEMAAYTGDSERTVERQLMRAKRALERAQAESDRAVDRVTARERADTAHAPAVGLVERARRQAERGIER